jgi:hypothetical protein
LKKMRTLRTSVRRLIVLQTADEPLTLTNELPELANAATGHMSRLLPARVAYTKWPENRQQVQ